MLTCVCIRMYIRIILENTVLESREPKMNHRAALERIVEQNRVIAIGMGDNCIITCNQCDGEQTAILIFGRLTVWNAPRMFVMQRYSWVHFPMQSVKSKTLYDVIRICSNIHSGMLWETLLM